MPDYASDTPIFLVKKVGGLVLLILGLLLIVLGYGYESNGLLILGVLVLAGGIALLVLKIVRRNQP
jgi:hypothetical protein